jgi:hypothetical protein
MIGLGILGGSFLTGLLGGRFGEGGGAFLS